MAYQNNPGEVYEVSIGHVHLDLGLGRSYVVDIDEIDLLPPGVRINQYQRSPVEPPPGLAELRTPASHISGYASPVSKPPVVIGNKDVSMFRDIAAFIDEDGIDSAAQPRIDLDCNICGEHKLEMPRHCSMFGPDDDEAYFKEEPFTVAPCGHIFGYHCLANWAWERIRQSQVPTCPVCRSTLVYPNCRHMIRMRPYNVRATRNSQLPRTVSEGGEVPDFCDQCEQESFEDYLHEVDQVVYPEEPASSYRDPRNNGVDRTYQLREEMRSHLSALYRANRDRMLRW